MPPPLLIVSCPGRTILDVKNDLLRAASAGADLGEVRIDRFGADERLRLEGLFPSPLPLVATLRSRSEGGEGPDVAADRAEILAHAAGLPFRYLDLERVLDAPLLAVGGPRSPMEALVIVSSHLSASTPIAEIPRLLELPRPPSAIAKVVVPCDFGRLWSELLPQLSTVGAFAPYVLHSTGTSGPLLRAWAHRLGMFAIYAALPSHSPSKPADSVEPAQLPVDQLRTYEQHGGAGPLFAVVGHPIQHSRSPALHSFWFRHEKRSGLYVALDLSNAEELATSLAPLADGGFRGLNVTRPWKQLALSLASRAGRAAELAGCANALTFDQGEIAADNTDVAAVRRRLSELEAAGIWDGSPVVVLGSGGAARSALAAVTTLNSSGVVVARRAELAESLVREYGGAVGIGPLLRPARVVIHATPAGRDYSSDLDLPWIQAIGPSTHVLDFVYEPTNPFIRERAEAQGASYEDGSRLLVYQAAESYALWWGAAPSDDLQNAAIREVMCAA